MPTVNWTPAERLAWAPREKLTPSQWVERHGWIPENGINPEPGPASLDLTPYLRGILDAIYEPGVRELDFLKCTQVGFSTLLRLFLSFAIDQEPGPALIILPDELSSKEWLDEDVVPTLEQTPRLKRHLLPGKHDNKASAIRTATMWMFAGWATSPQRLARRPIRYFLGDEVDKYPQFSGKESGPIPLGFKRLSNWRSKARAILGSTPTTRAGEIWKRWEACPDRRRYNVPCPHCGHYQVLVWPQVKGWKGVEAASKKDLANRIEIDSLAYYECIKCSGRIEDRHKYQMLLKGVWASEGQEVLAGILHGDRPRSTKVGFHLTSLYSPWLTFSQLAAEWVQAEGDVALTMDFYNSRLAEPFDQQIAKTKASAIREKIKTPAGVLLPHAPPPLIVPKWAKALIATGDTQGSDFATGWMPFVIRAWAYGYRSQLVHYGICTTWEELKGQCLDRAYQIDGGGMVQPSWLLQDSGGHRTSDVYDFALSDPVRVRATKGASRRLDMPLEKRHLKKKGLLLLLIDTEQAKDLLNRLIHDPDPLKWMPHAGVNDDYCNQLASEHKIVHPRTKKVSWELVTGGTANHFLDCEAAQCAAAWELGYGLEEPEAPNAAPSDVEELENPLAYGGKY